VGASSSCAVTVDRAQMSEGTGVRFVRITDINQVGELRHEEPAFVPKGTPELDSYELEDGDVLIARSGATAGKSYIHYSFGERAVFAGYLIRFQPDTTKILPCFIKAFLQTPNYWQQLNSHKRAVAQPLQIGRASGHCRDSRDRKRSACARSRCSSCSRDPSPRNPWTNSRAPQIAAPR
jgi:hypothetical protein